MNVFKKVLKPVLPLVLGGFILFWIYRDFDFSAVGTVLFQKMNWRWMLLSLTFGACGYMIRGWRWKQVLEPMGVSPGTNNCVNAVFVSYAVGLLLPKLGEISRCGILAKYGNVSFMKSLGTMVTERLIDVLCIAVITIVALLFQQQVFNRFFAETGINLSNIPSGFTSLRFYLILGGVVVAIALLLYLMYKLSFFKRLKKPALHVWEGVMSLRGVKNIPLFTLFTVLIWFCYFMHFYIAFFCFPFTEHLSVWAGLVMFIGGTFSFIVPTPAGAGSWHFVIISMMSLYGVNITDAGIFALLVHGIQTLSMILLGIYGMAMLSFLNKTKAHQ
ncbi:MAG: flippase-like domain-containing protein [Mediterranea sp.]|jgi:uncharacterized membrane protein YbhN (UPF0104 family)|nr:flippase-like domain-containing protein [Mediterranea sp.]